MATKKEIYEASMQLCEQYKAKPALVEALKELLEPKSGGAAFNIDEVAVRDADGAVTHILDSVFKLWVPVFDSEGEPNFYEKPDTELGWSRFSRAAEKARKDAEKTFKATKDAVFADLMSGVIDGETAKSMMDEAESKRKDYTVPEELNGTTERPEAA